MTSAPYVQSRPQATGTVYYVKAPKAVRNAFPELRNETYRSKNEAAARGYSIREAYREWKLDQANISLAFTDERSVNGLILKYMASNMFRELGDTSKRNYRGALFSATKSHVGDSRKTFGDMLAVNVNYNTAVALYQDFVDAVSANTAQHVIKRLRIAWGEAIRMGMVNTNPFSNMRLKMVKTRQVMWTKEQVKYMVDYCDAHNRVSIGTMIILCFHFCQRVGDMRQLTWSSIGKDGIANFTQEKTGVEMSIPVTDGIRERLKLHTRNNSDDIIVRYEGTGRPYSQGRLDHVFADLREASDLPDHIWLNDLRRTGTTYASRDGCTDRELISLTGHKNPKMLIIYAMHGNEEAANAMKKRNL
jgi:integrase